MLFTENSNNLRDITSVSPIAIRFVNQTVRVILLLSAMVASVTATPALDLHDTPVRTARHGHRHLDRFLVVGLLIEDGHVTVGFYLALRCIN